jgi:hypothetical protein
MTREQFLARVKKELVDKAIESETKMVVQKVLDGTIPIDQIREFVDTLSEFSAAAVDSGLRQAEAILDQHLSELPNTAIEDSPENK